MTSVGMRKQTRRPKDSHVLIDILMIHEENQVRGCLPRSNLWNLDFIQYMEPQIEIIK